MVLLLDGKKTAKKLLDDLKKQIESSSLKIKLATIFDQKNPGSSMYVNMKVKKAAQVGIESEEFKVDESWNTDKVVSLVRKLNDDPTVSGILVQSPLPETVDEKIVFDEISPLKDADGLTAKNQGLLFQDSKIAHALPATPSGVIKLLNEYDFVFSGKQALVIGRSVLFGRPMSLLLVNRDMTVTLAHSKTPKETLIKEAKNADLIIVAVGKAEWFDLQDLKNSAVVIDVGANRKDSKAVGDVNFDEVSKRVAAITPVPGGVGPMTIATLIEQTYNLALEQKRRKISMKKAVITVVGDDKPGIIAAVSTRLSENQINILDVSQTLMDNVFTMSMLVDITKVDDKFQELQNSLKELGKNMSVSIHTQRQEIFDTISKI